MSDSPTLFTGFGRVTRELLCHLAYAGQYEIACVGWGYDGWPFDRRHLPFEIYPSAPGSLGRDSLPRAIHEFRPDLLITLGDIWMVEWLSSEEAIRNLSLLPYVPIDGQPLYPPWNNFLDSVEAVVACSKYGARLLKASGTSANVHTIYHGVNTSVFRPLAPSRPSFLEEKFVVGCVARNQPRKNLPVLIEGFAEFARDKKDVVLYLHSDPDDVGWDLLDLLRRHRIFDQTCISAHASITQGVRDEQLNEIYNQFDVMVLPSAGEGFGLPILEAMAAGVPVIATDYSACTELLVGRGQLIKVASFVTAGRHNVQYAIPDLNDLVLKLNVGYGDRDLLKRHSQAGRAFALGLDWDGLVGEWDSLIRSFTTELC